MKVCAKTHAAMRHGVAFDNAIQLRSLRLNSPAESALRVKTSCERIKWQAGDALRVRPPR
jgi:hypothetical protein